MQDCTAPQSGPLSTHTSSALCMKGVWCRSGGVPLTAHCSLHCTTERSVGPQVDGKGGHAVVCLPGRLCQVPTPPHCHTAPVPQPPQQVLSAALSMCECGRCSPVAQQEGCVPLSCRQPLHWNDLDTTRAQGRDPIKLNTCYKTEHAYNHA